MVTPFETLAALVLRCLQDLGVPVPPQQLIAQVLELEATAPERLLDPPATRNEVRQAMWHVVDLGHASFTQDWRIYAL